MSSEFNFRVPFIVAKSSMKKETLEELKDSSTIVSGPPAPQKKQEAKGPLDST